MRAKLTDRPNKFTRSHRKETPCFLSCWVVIDLSKKPYTHGGDMPETVCLRVYVTKSGATSAAVWIHGANGFHSSGTGAAGGGGYHKASAAAAYALKNAGVDLSRDIDGRGNGAISEAVLAVAKAAGAKRPALVCTYA